MELKVWVEGIQRIVCGVNDKTTCQDVVYALAHATGKTGRFTLIERWRNSERLLAPSEQPLKVLLKWGEHSNDVQFILQWSPLDPGGTRMGKSGAGLADGISQNEASHSPSSLSSSKSTNHSNLQSGVGHGMSSHPSSQSSNGPSKKGISSSTMSPLSSNDSRNLYHRDIDDGGGGSSRSDSNGVAALGSRGIPQRDNDVNNRGFHNNSLSPTNSSPSLSELCGVNPNGKVITGVGTAMSSLLIEGSKDGGVVSSSSSSKLKDFNLSTPPPYREPPNPHNNPVGGGVSSKGLLPPYREPPPPNLMYHQNHPITGQQRLANNNSLVLMQQKHSGNSAGSGVQANPSVINPGHHSPFNNSNNSSSGVISPNSLCRDEHQSGCNSCSCNCATKNKDSTRLPPHTQQEAFFNSPDDNSDNFSAPWKNQDQSVTNGDVQSSNQNGSAPLQSPVSGSNSQYIDLVRLINLQREKLTSQQAELTQYDAEIMFWEGKAREQQRHMEYITKEIARLELVSKQHEGQVLTLAHLEEEHDFVKQESDALKTELSGLRNELTKCEKELVQCKNRIRMLVDELRSNQMHINQRQEEWVQREANTLSEIERLKKELDVARRETDAVSDLSGSLDKEVHLLESTLMDKKRQMERLVAAMKEANLQSLTVNPPDETIDGSTHHRSGSTRRMIGSPRQLENAAPTSKNPHGVWV